MNRKGQTDMFMDVMSYLLFVVIVIVFFLMFNLIKGCNNPAVERISSDTESRLEHDMYFISILKTPVNLSGETYAVKDLIWQYYDSRDAKYLEAIRVKVEDIFFRYPYTDPKTGNRLNCFDLIVEAEKPFILITPACCEGLSGSAAYESALALPVPFNDEDIVFDARLRLYNSKECDGGGQSLAVESEKRT